MKLAVKTPIVTGSSMGIGHHAQYRDMPVRSAGPVRDTVTGFWRGAIRARFIRSLIILSLTLPALWAEPAGAQQCTRTNVEGRPHIGLALGGGGARGYAHVGVLKMLEELRIPYDYIAGTSMGSIVGGLAATGMTPDEIEVVVRDANWADLFEDDTAREDLSIRRKQDDVIGLYGPKLGVGENNELLPSGFVAGQKILFLFETMTSQRVQTTDFDQLPVPFRAVATDIGTGDEVILADGNLAIAMRASMSVPGVFDPVAAGDLLLVDGGLVNNLPVSVVRDMGADIVIAVSVGTPLKATDEITDVLAIVDQMTSLAIVANTSNTIQSLTAQDVLVSPDLGDVSAGDFTMFEEGIPTGYAAAEAVRERLSVLSVSESEYRRWRNGVEGCLAGPPDIHFVRLDNRSQFGDEVIEELITIEPGRPLDVQQLDHDLRQIYGLGFIRIARYEIVEEDGRQGVLIRVLQDDRGPDFIETGLTLTGGDQGLLLNLQAGYLKTDLDKYGAELRTAIQLGDDFALYADYFKPLDKRLRWIFNPQAFYSRRDVLLFNEFGQKLAAVEVDELNGSLRFGYAFGRAAILSAKVAWYGGSVDTNIGVPIQSFDYDGGDWGVEFFYDQLDNRYLPTRGTLFNVDYVQSDESLGADTEFEQVRMTLMHSWTWGRHNMMLFTRYNTTLDSDAPIYALFSGGGFLNMSGFQPNELVGQHFGLVGAGYRFELGRTGLLPAYAGITFEYGNAAERRDDIFDDGIFNGAMYLGYESPIGPLYLGYGYNADHSGLFFLRLGTVLGSNGIGRR